MMQFRTKIPILVPAFYILLMIYVVWSALIYPNRNWDMICYIGSVVSWNETTPQSIWDAAFGSLKDNVPDYVYQGFLTNPLSATPDAYVQQVPFCQVKPLYNVFIWFFHQVGLALPVASWVTSSLCFATLAAVLFLWRPRYMARSAWLLLVIGLVFLGEEPMYTLSRLSTPDALGTLLTVAAILTWLKYRAFIPYCLLGLAAILARPDTLIPIGIFTVYFTLFASKEYHIQWLKAGVYIAVLLISTAVVKHASQGPNYTYEHFFIYSFFKRIPNPAEMTDHLSWDEYQYIFTVSLGEILRVPRVIVLLVLTALAGFCHYMKPMQGNRLWFHVLLLTWASWGTRFVLWPASHEYRFYYAYCIMIVLACGELMAPYLATLRSMLQEHRRRIQA